MLPARYQVTAAAIAVSACCLLASSDEVIEPFDLDLDLAWVEQPQGWHQQAIRIVDHPFTSLAELRSFGLQAKRAGVSVVQLVGPQKTKRCVGYVHAAPSVATRSV